MRSLKASSLLLTLEQRLTCFTMPSAGQPGHGLQEGSRVSGWSGSPALLASAGNSLSSQRFLGMGLARMSLGLLLTALPHSVTGNRLSACSLQVLGPAPHSGLRSFPRPTQQPQLNSQVLCGAFTCRQRKL